jgi:hypothetical protein
MEPFNWSSVLADTPASARALAMNDPSNSDERVMASCGFGFIGRSWFVITQSFRTDNGASFPSLAGITG